MTDDLVARLRRQARNRYADLVDGELAARQTVEWKAADWFEARVRELEAEIGMLCKALEFYANPEIYKPHPHGPAFERRDLSGVAIEALICVEDDD